MSKSSRARFALFAALLVSPLAARASSVSAVSIREIGPRLSIQGVVNEIFGAKDKTRRVLPWLEFGGGMDKFFYKYANGGFGFVRFYNAVTHILLPHLGGLRVDGRVGVSDRSVLYAGGEFHSGLAPTAETGLSLPILLAKNVTLEPMVGVRYVQNGSQRAVGGCLGPTGGMSQAAVLLTVSL